MMRMAYYFEIKTPYARTARAIRFKDFHLMYLMIKLNSNLASKYNGKLTIRKLTLWVSIKHWLLTSTKIITTIRNDNDIH